MARIFISYRREDCPAHAGRLADSLNARFGEGSVFMDVDTIELGIDFVARIEQAVGDCDVVLALIGDEWLTVTDRGGTRRIDKPDDFVRIELTEALARDDVRVVPVLVEGAEMPTAADLPDPLAPLARRNGISLTDTRWRSDTAVLTSAIERAMGADDSRGRSPQRSPTGDRPPASSTRPRSYLWLVPPLVTLGGLTFVYFGLRAGQRRWVIIGCLYAIPATVFWMALLLDSGGIELGIELEVVSTIALLVSWPLVVTHLLAVRPQYLEKIAGT